MRFRNLSKVLPFVISLLPITSVFADDVNVVGSKEQTLNIHGNKSAAAKSAESKKIIQLLRVELTPEAKARLQREAKAITSTPVAKRSFSALPSSTQLGMSNVPVLDQGQHGTCATFAVTAAIDARLNKGDYVSQLCYLQLGNYLQKNGLGLSGWDGEYTVNIINNITQYGVMNKSQQKSKGCGGLYEYPGNSKNPKSFIEPAAYQAMSEMVFGTAINWAEIPTLNSEAKFNEAKEAIASGDRLIFSVLLPRLDLGTAGAVGRHKNWFFPDSWILSPEVMAGIEDIEAAHAMVITGFDDNAIAQDSRGNKHKGLFKLRNSWGSDAGDYGEFYMSYDYFKLLAYNVKKVY